MNRVKPIVISKYQLSVDHHHNNTRQCVMSGSVHILKKGHTEFQKIISKKVFMMPMFQDLLCWVACNGYA